VANAAGAIPETLGDAGILLDDKSPDRVAEALERVVSDQGERARLIALGERRLQDFSRERVRERLKDALAVGGYELPDERKREDGRALERSALRHPPLRARGLRRTPRARPRRHVRRVRHLDTEDLRKKLRFIRDDVETILIEHEAGIFRDVPFVQALQSCGAAASRSSSRCTSSSRRSSIYFRASRPRSTSARATPVRWSGCASRGSGCGSWTGSSATAACSRSWAGFLTAHRPQPPVRDLARAPHLEGGKKDEFPLIVMPLEDTELPEGNEGQARAARTPRITSGHVIFVSPGFFLPA